MKGISPMAMIRIGRLWSRISYGTEECGQTLLCSHYITFVDNLWPVLLRWFPYTVRAGHVRFVSLPVPLCRKKHGAYRL